MNTGIHSFLFLILLTACRRTPPAPRSEIQYLSIDQDVLYLQASGSAPRSEAAQKAAERHAFETLLFRGVPGSPQEIPMIAERQREAALRTAFIRELLDHQGYRRYLTSAQPRTEPRPFTDRQHRRQYQSSVTLGIQYTALRRELEAQSIIPRFGF
jgi:hypothetical protein